MARRIKCFWVEPTGVERTWLRRYRRTHAKDGTPIETIPCPLPPGYHEHMVFLKDRPVGSWRGQDDPDKPSAESVSWPSHCNCGYAFTDVDHRQLFVNELYKGAPDGQLYPLREMPAGAMWNADWLAKYDWAKGPDGIALMVKLPNGHDWAVDTEASNCTDTQWRAVPGEKGTRRWQGRSHYCWVRHGDPRTGNVHVDKRGPTCKAGAGSILSGDYHGFLRHGYLED